MSRDILLMKEIEHILMEKTGSLLAELQSVQYKIAMGLYDLDEYKREFKEINSGFYTLLDKHADATSLSFKKIHTLTEEISYYLSMWMKDTTLKAKEIAGQVVGAREPNDFVAFTGSTLILDYETLRQAIHGFREYIEHNVRLFSNEDVNYDVTEVKISWADRKEFLLNQVIVDKLIYAIDGLLMLCHGVSEECSSITEIAQIDSTTSRQIFECLAGNDKRVSEYITKKIARVKKLITVAEQIHQVMHFVIRAHMVITNVCHAYLKK